jgi:hypothetical protein
MNVLALASIIPLVFGAVGTALQPGLAVNRGALLGMFAVIAVFNILNLVFSLLMPVAVIATIDEVSHGRALDVNDAYKKAFSVGIPYLFVLLLSGIVVLGGSIFLIIPGIIANVYLMFVIFVFLFEGKRGIDALIQSAWYVRGLWIDIFARKIAAAIVVVLAVIVFSAVVGSISIVAGFGPSVFSFLFRLFLFMLVVPFTLCFAYVIYKDVHAVKAHSAPSPAFRAEAERIFIILMLIAALAALAIFVFWNFGSHHFFGMMIDHTNRGGRYGGRMMIHYNSHGFMGY